MNCSRRWHPEVCRRPFFYGTSSLVVATLVTLLVEGFNEFALSKGSPLFSAVSSVPSLSTMSCSSTSSSSCMQDSTSLADANDNNDGSGSCWCKDGKASPPPEDEDDEDDDDDDDVEDAAEPETKPREAAAL